MCASRAFRRQPSDLTPWLSNVNLVCAQQSSTTYQTLPTEPWARPDTKGQATLDMTVECLTTNLARTLSDVFAAASVARSVAPASRALATRSSSASACCSAAPARDSYSITLRTHKSRRAQVNPHCRLPKAPHKLQWQHTLAGMSPA